MIRALSSITIVLLAASTLALGTDSRTTFAKGTTPLACPVLTEPVASDAGQRVPVSAGVIAGNRIGGKNPKYPSKAKKAGVQGTVVLRAIISASGQMEELCVVQGPAMLQQPAFDAVRTWRYKPYTLNGQPVKVETQVNVVFTLGG